MSEQQVRAQIADWLRSDDAKRAMHSWVMNHHRAHFLSESDLMTDALPVLADLIQQGNQPPSSAGSV